MFDISEAYTGNMVPSEGSVKEQQQSGEVTKSLPQTAEEILQYAREEAADILEKAQIEAQELLAQKHKQANEEADRIITMKVNQTFNALGTDLWSAQAGIANIVKQSLHLMLGAIGTDKAFALAVNKATSDFTNTNTLKVHAHPDSANRLRLYNIGNQEADFSARYEIIDDTSLEPERCILDTGEKRLEVSLGVQVEALKRSMENTLSNAKASGGKA